MSANELDYRGIAINLLIGGVINFGALIFLDMTVYSIMGWIYRSFGIYGVLAFEEAQNAYYIIRLGTVFLSSGFLGGLYAGYKIKENLRVIMAFPGLIGLLLTLTLQFFLRTLSIQHIFGLVKNVIIPLMVLVSGSYLGGYTLNWRVEEKLEEERISLISA